MEPISFYLGLKIERNCQNKTLKLSQPTYIKKILTKYHFNQVKPYNTLIKEVILLPNKNFEANQADQKQYQRITKLLIFLIVRTKPDIAFATSVVNCFTKNLS